MLKRENNFQAYKPSIQYPKKPVHPSIHNFPDNTAGAGEYVKAMQVYETEYKTYETRLNEYRSQISAGEKNFRHDLEAENCTEGFPQDVKDVLYSKAYAHGHSEGYNGIANWYEELVEIADACKFHMENVK